MHLLIALVSAVALFALAATSSSEVTAQGVGIGFARTANQTGPHPAKLYHQAKAKQAGSCGTYMYWKKGKCNDARDKK
jgi:hypothetical protein